MARAGFVVRVPESVDVKAIRRRLGLSQRRFAERFGFKLDAVQNWGQGRRHPEGPACAFLRVIEREPEAVERALSPKPRTADVGSGDGRVKARCVLMMCKLTSPPILCFLLFLLVLWPGTIRAEPIPLTEETNASLVEILTGMQILGERFDPIDATQPYMIRLIRVRTPGECGGSPESCPKETVYVAISSRGEDPDRKLYRLPEAYGWDLYQWSHFPQRDTPDEFIVFTMIRTVIAADTSKGWWKTEYYVVKVNTRSATIESR